MQIVKIIWIWIVKLCGWKLILPEKGTRPEVDRCVFVVAPHTSALDFTIGATFLWSISKNGKVFIKKEFFVWPLGPILRSLGCISIKRGNPTNNMVKKAKEEFKKNKNLSIAITPEGTRKPRKKWARGFWAIARESNVPIVPAYINFKKKEIGIFDTIWPCKKYEEDDKNYKEDLKKVQKLYHKEMAKHPENFIEFEE